MVVDITEHFDAKIDALLAHQSQVGGSDGLADRLRERAQEVAKDEPFELGEAFKTVKMRR
jgi:LmbE family N-acetylglucosaminyl deacetylase